MGKQAAGLARLAGSLRGRLNSWDEICTNENARLRTNTVFCTTLVAGFSLVMMVVNLLRGAWAMGGFLLLLFVAYGFMSGWQLFHTQYQRWAAWIFGLTAIAMSVILLVFGSSGGLGYVWVYTVPLVAVMVVPFKDSLVYNGLLLGVMLAVLHTPLRQWLRFDYSSAFGLLFPMSLLAVMGCAYLAEVVRSRTQKRLAHTASELSAFAFTDPLTGSFNRHALGSHFGEAKTADASGLTVAVFDLDHFKRVNDTYGHIVGDKVLKHVVQLARECIPPNATLYRWGGEEFLLVLKTSDAEAAWQVLETVRQTVADTPLQTGEVTVSITLSIGARCAEPGDTLHQCIALADSRLYAAKAGGRNRTVMGPEETPPAGGRAPVPAP